MKNSKRSLRRYHKRRMKRKARKIYPGDPEAHKLADHLKFCNGYCCRMCEDNKHWKEFKIADQNMKEQIKEWREEAA